LRYQCAHPLLVSGERPCGGDNPFAALTDQTSPKSVAQRRGKKVADLLGRGGASEAEAEADAAAMVE
jgi:hypothetical protein